MRKDGLEFCEGELKKYFSLMAGGECEIALSVDAACGGVADPLLDDAWEIDVTAGKGKIVGCNARSALFGVYRFFFRLGARFLAPGREILPPHRREEMSVCARETPPDRYRVMVIEGSCSAEQAEKMVDYAAKQCFNAYFIQGFNGYPFYRRYYAEEGFPAADGRPFDYALADEYCARLEGEVKKRGLFLHSVGHGFNAVAVGCEKYGWNEAPDDVAEPFRDRLAQIDGKRKFCTGSPINTNLCYSRADVRLDMANAAADYAERHPDTDYLHVWLADWMKNHCECEACARKTPSDWYVALLNEIDRVFTARKIATKVVFLIYTDLLPPPKSEWIANPDRFVMMFAPISRTYVSSYDRAFARLGEEAKNYREFARNHTPLFLDLETNLVYLQKWREIFPGECFSFEYYFMWEQYKEFGQHRLAEVAFRDAAALRAAGLGGMLSVQVTRAFFPNAFGDYALGRALADGDASFFDVEEEFFTAFYGADGGKIADGLRLLGMPEVFAYNRAEVPSADERSSRAFALCADRAKDLIDYLAAHGGEGEFEEKNRAELSDYLKIVCAQCRVLEKKCLGKDVAKEYEREVLPLIADADRKYHEDIDACTMRSIFNTEALANWEDQLLPRGFADAKE